MNAFQQVYPFAILTLGITNALFALGTGFFCAVMLWRSKPADDVIARVLPGAFFMFAANIVAGVTLAWTRWMLT